jgi:S1-C subfamily serine protease
MKTALTVVAMVMLSTPALSAQLISDGSGVAISSHQILTANHVIDGCTRVTIPSYSNSVATVGARDPATDLAVLSISWEMSESNIVSFRVEPFRIGDPVIVVGYPLHGYMASSLNLTTGNVSAMAGYKDDPNSYTITAPVQPGNSGGPVLDDNGHLIGIVTSRLDKSSDGQTAQNVNFAVKSSVIASFLRSHYLKYQTDNFSNAKMTAAEVGEKARLFTVKINCYGDATAATPTEPACVKTHRLL